MKDSTIFWMLAAGVGIICLSRAVKNSVAGLMFRVVAIRDVSAGGAVFILEVFNDSRIPVPALSLELDGIILVNGVRIGNAVGSMDSVIMPGSSSLMPIAVAVENNTILTALIGVGVALGSGNANVNVEFMGNVFISGVAFPLKIQNIL